MRCSQLIWSALVVLTSCDRPAAEPQLGSARTFVDSILPTAEEVRRFRIAHQVIEPVNLRDGADSRDGLVQSFVTAIEQSDTSALRNMLIDVGEFITLYYPTSPFARSPYRQSPAFVWFQVQQHSQQGMTRVLTRFGGQSAGFRSYQCAAGPSLQGENRLWERCTINWRFHETPIRVFGSIIERKQRFKFVSYTNDF